MRHKDCSRLNLNVKVFTHEIICKTLRDGAYAVILNKYKSIGTHWIALYANGNSVTYFDGFGAKHIPEDISNNNVMTNILRIQANDLIMYEYFSIGFIDFMLKGKS